MSYYQLISLKLQMGIDPDAIVDYKTLLKMWKVHQQDGARSSRPAMLRKPQIRPRGDLHFRP